MLRKAATIISDAARAPAPSPAGDWHEYRAEVRQNQLTLKIDGSAVLQAVDNNYLEAGGSISERFTNGKPPFLASRLKTFGRCATRPS